MGCGRTVPCERSPRISVNAFFFPMTARKALASRLPTVSGSRWAWLRSCCSSGGGPATSLPGIAWPCLRATALCAAHAGAGHPFRHGRHLQTQTFLVLAFGMVLESHHAGHRWILLCHLPPLTVAVRQLQRPLARAQLRLDRRSHSKIFPRLPAPLDERVHYPGQARWLRLGVARRRYEDQLLCVRTRTPLPAHALRRCLPPEAFPALLVFLHRITLPWKPILCHQLPVGPQQRTFIHPRHERDASRQRWRKRVPARRPARHCVLGGADQGGKFALRQPQDPPQLAYGFVRLGIHICMETK